MLKSEPGFFTSTCPVLLVLRFMHFSRSIDGSLSQLDEIEAAADKAHPGQFSCGTRAQLIGLVARDDELGTARSVLFEMPAIILAPAAVGESSRESAVSGDSLVP